MDLQINEIDSDSKDKEATSNNNKNLKIISDNPSICQHSKFLTSQQCKYIIELARSDLKKNIINNFTGKQKLETLQLASTEVVSSQDCDYSKNFISLNWEQDEYLLEIVNNIINTLDISINNLEDIKVFYYKKKEKFLPHFDSWKNDKSKKFLNNIKYGGNRTKTIICFLNSIKKGGGIKFTKLNNIVKPTRGNLLSIQNTNSNNSQHFQSEYQFLEIEEGESFYLDIKVRECNINLLYKDFNPSFYKFDPTLKLNEKLNFTRLCEDKEIYFKNNCIDHADCVKLKTIVKLKEGPRRKEGWIPLKSDTRLIRILENILNINHKFYENINVVEYECFKPHNLHYNCWEINSDSGKKYTKNLGQRIFTVCIFLTSDILVSFPHINVEKTFDQCSLLVYKNTVTKDLERDKDLEHLIEHKMVGETGYIANIHIRSKCKDGSSLNDISFAYN